MRRSISPGSLKRKRDSPSLSHSRSSLREVSKSVKLTNGATSLSDSTNYNATSTTNGPITKLYTSPDSDDMHQSDPGDLLRGVGSASSLNSTASSVFSHNSHAFAHNRKASVVNGLTPLTNHTESSPPKGNSPQNPKSLADMATTNGVFSTSHVPASDTTPEPSQRRDRPQMLPPPGKAKGYSVSWEPERDN